MGPLGRVLFGSAAMYISTAPSIVRWLEKHAFCLALTDAALNTGTGTEATIPATTHASSRTTASTIATMIPTLDFFGADGAGEGAGIGLSLIHISEPTRLGMIS